MDPYFTRGLSMLMITNWIYIKLQTILFIYTIFNDNCYIVFHAVTQLHDIKLSQIAIV